MLYYRDLEKIIFNRSNIIKSDELIIISGYVGPNPIHDLNNLNLKSTVIYGMYGCDGIHRRLHEQLLKEDNISDKVNIYYSTLPIHSKCYIWRNKGDVVHALIGSANFSANGLITDYKESLAETTTDTFASLNEYFNIIFSKAISPSEAIVTENLKKQKYPMPNVTQQPGICSAPLYLLDKDGEKYIPKASGLNWGMASLNGSHVNINDAEIRITAEMTAYYPEMFPLKQESPTKDIPADNKKRDNDFIELLWDDGETMVGLLEGSRKVSLADGRHVEYPKQIASASKTSARAKKAILGKYLRRRLGVAEGKLITMRDLERYGRDTIDISLQGEGIYYFDFSV